MKNHAYSRKKRQLKFLSERLEDLLQKKHHSASAEVHGVILKIKRLLAELKHVLPGRELKKALGGLAVLFGISAANELQGQIQFGNAQNNPFGFTATYTIAIPASADLDNDGDFDLLVGEYGGGVQYYENTGSATSPQFAAPVSAPFGIDTSVTWMVSAPALVDLDNDGDMDLMLGTDDLYDTPLVYFENTGTAASPQFRIDTAFTLSMLQPDLFGIPSFADLDGDGDMDMLVGEYYGYMTYYENTGSATTPHFSPPQTNPFGLTSSYIISAPSFADLDQDGDMDLLVGEYYYGNLRYFENTGSATAPQFANAVNNPFGINAGSYYAFPAFTDLDDDGDMDLLVGEYDGNMVYYENTSTFSIGEVAGSFGAELFPNPAADYVEIDSREHIARVEVLDVTGRPLFTLEEPQGKISVENLAPGTYLLKLVNADSEVVTRRLTVN